MRARHFRMSLLKMSAEPRTPRTTAKKLAFAMLAMTLIVTAAIPSIAGKPNQGRHRAQQEQRQQHDVSATKKRRANKTKIVTKTFANNQVVNIPALDAVLSEGPADPYPSTIVVNGLKRAKIADVNVTLHGLSHTFPADLDVLLVAPGGRNALVMDEVGRVVEDASVTNITLTLDDEAATALPAEEVLTDGSFRPLAVDPSALDFPDPAPAPSGSVALSTFDGSNPNGEWQLFIVDDAQDDSGQLTNGWTLEITAKSKAKNTGKKKR